MTPSTLSRSRMRDAINNFYDHHGLLGFAIARVKQVEDASVGTLAINDKALLYNPAFVAEQTPNDMNFIIVHEAAHIFLGHHVRFAHIFLDFEKKYGRKLTAQEEKGLFSLANVAADLALNQTIAKMDGVPTPSQKLQEKACFVGVGLFKDFETDKSMEFYFKKLYEQAQQNQQQQDKQNGNQEQEQGGQGSEGEGQQSEGQGEQSAGPDGAGDEGAEGDAGDSGQDGDGGTGSGQSGSPVGDKASDGKGSVCSGESNEQRDGEPMGGRPQGGEVSNQGSPRPSTLARIAESLTGDPAPGEVRPAVCASEEELEEAEEKWEQLVMGAVAQAKSQGFTPGWLAEFAGELFPKSSICWKTKLRRFFDRSCREGYSYKRPNRRQAWRRDVIMPARLGKTSGLGCVVVDVSRSMSIKECDLGLGVVSEIVASLPGNVEVEMIQIDTRVCNRRTYHRADFPLRAQHEWLGRGGTVIQPIMDEIRNAHGKYKWVILVTDGGWQFEAIEDIKTPTFWLFTGKQSRSPKFGEQSVIQM